VRLRYAYVVRCTGAVKDERGEVVEVRCTYDPATQGGAAPAGRKVPGTLHWVSAAHAVDVEVRLYDRLFRDEQPDAAGDYRQGLNPDSLEVIAGAKAEPGLAAAEPGSRFQFERQGYFYREPESSQGDGGGRPVFNRIVTLKDTWAKLAQRQREEQAQPRGDRGGHGARPTRSPEADVAAARTADDGERGRAGSAPAIRTEAADTPELAELRDRHDIAVEAARVLAVRAPLRRLFDEGVAAGAAARPLANWIANELQRELEAAGVDAANAPFGGAELAELLALVDDGTLSATAGKTVLAELVRAGGSPRVIVAARGLAQVSDAAALGDAVSRVVAREEANAAAYRGGRTGLLGWFVGQVMKETGGRANPQLVQQLVRERLDAGAG